MQKLTISSESLTYEGKWKTVIYADKANPSGQNLSPQLSWNVVENAKCYAVYMFDLSAGNWLHWKAINIETNILDLGAELSQSEYVGPYPPSGTHTYEVIVFALKEKLDIFPGNMDDCNSSINKVEEKIDSPHGKSGNIICKEKIDGTVTVGLYVK